MNRRLFTQLLFTSPFTVPVMVSVRSYPSTSLLIQTSPLAGFQYYAGEKLWAKMRQGDLLDMLREPGNPYDKRAVALFWNGYKIGYIPRRENTAITQMLDRQMSLTANISNLNQSDDPWERIEITIGL